MLCKNHLMQGQGHLEGPNSVHVCSDDGDSSVASLGVSEGETPQKIHLKTYTNKQITTKQNGSIQTSDGGCVFTLVSSYVSETARSPGAVYSPRSLT